MDELIGHRHPRQEAEARLPAGWTARVLEPSPPAVDDGEFFADDPASIGTAAPTTTVVPLSEGRSTWQAIAATDSELEAFARTRWLGPWNRLGPVPDGYDLSRCDFHRLAYAVVAAPRHEANGKFGLRFTAGGFGTPFFARDRQIRVVGELLVDQAGNRTRVHRPTTIADAAEFVGVEPMTIAAESDSPALGDIDRPLVLTSETGAFLGNWFGFAASVLEELRATAASGSMPGRLQLWPGHFDPAIELGREAEGQRATFGASPGDHGSHDPYLYIGPWAGVTDHEFWNATSFPGAVLGYEDLVAATDQRAGALSFFRRGIELLSARPQ